jgi:hypothetical protein
MLFSPRSSKTTSSRAVQGVPVANLSQQLLSQQVSTLLGKVQTLNEQVEKRDQLLDYAKSNCKKRFVPTLEKQFSVLQQAPRNATDRRKPTDWLYLGETNTRFNEGLDASDVEIMEGQSDEDIVEGDFHTRVSEHDLEFNAEESDDEADSEDVE